MVDPGESVTTLRLLVEGRDPASSPPTGGSSGIRFHWWTRGESDPLLLHAMQACYRYTTGPSITIITVMTFITIKF